jgi:hypothetical protein
MALSNVSIARFQYRGNIRANFLTYPEKVEDNARNIQAAKLPICYHFIRQKPAPEENPGSKRKTCGLRPGTP